MDIHDSAGLDSYLKKVFTHDMEKNKGVKPPPHKFEEIITNIEMRRGKRRLKTLAKKSLITCAIVFLVFTSLYLVYPEEVTSAGRKVIHSFTFMFTDKSNEDSEGHWYLDEGDPAVIKKLYRATEEAPFPVKLPAYLPEGSELVEVAVEIDEDRFILELYFEHSNINFSIVQMEAPGSGFVAILSDFDMEHTTDILINDKYKGVMAYKENSSSLSFIGENNVKYLLSGRLPEEEMMEIAGSFRNIIN